MSSSDQTFPSGFRVTTLGGSALSTFHLAVSGTVTVTADEAGRPIITAEDDRELVTLGAGDLASMFGRRRSSDHDHSASVVDRPKTYGVRFFDDLDSVEEWLVNQAIPEDLESLGVEVTDDDDEYVRQAVHQVILEIRGNLAKDAVIAAG